MTNQQLALLLNQIAARLKNLANEIEPTITDGERELTQVWVGEGEKPSLFSMDNFVSKNWEWRNEGEFTAIKKVLDFAEELEIEAEDLVKDQQPNKALHTNA